MPNSALKHQMDVRLTCSIMLCYCNVKRKGGFIYDERCYFCVAKAIANYKEMEYSLC